MTQATSHDLLRNSIAAWCAYAGRKLNDRAQEAWVLEFSNTEPGILGQALTLVTSRAKRMPWPGDLTEAIGIIRDRRAPKEFQPRFCDIPGIGKDPETGAAVDVWIDPDDNRPGDRLMYRMTDCPEGRKFRDAMRKLKNRF